MRRVRDVATKAVSDPITVLRALSAGQVVSLTLVAASLRSRPPVSDLLRAHATATRCRIAVAETGGIVVRWVDGIVSGTAEDLLRFLAATEPVLARIHGKARLVATMTVPEAASPAAQPLPSAHPVAA